MGKRKPVKIREELLFDASRIIFDLQRKEKNAREDADRLRPACEGAICADCMAWLSAEASAELWHEVALLVAKWVAKQKAKVQP